MASTTIIARNPIEWYVSVDGSPHSTKAAKFVATRIAKKEDTIRLIYALPGHLDEPAAPKLAIGAAYALHATLREAHQQQQESARALLAKVSTEVRENKDALGPRIELHTVPAGAGNASVARSLEAFAESGRAIYPASVLVTGRRGLKGAQGAIAALAGAGSVSGYFVHHATTPVLVVGAETEEAESLAPRRLVVAVDGSEASEAAFRWVLGSMVRSGDELHLVRVIDIPDDAIINTDAPGAVAEERRSAAEAVEVAGKGLDVLVAAARANVPARVSVQGTLLSPREGREGTAAAILAYARRNKATLLVTGNRGLGAFKRAVFGVFGVGSVSDRIVCDWPGAVLVWKEAAGAATASPAA